MFLCMSFAFSGVYPMFGCILVSEYTLLPETVHLLSPISAEPVNVQLRLATEFYKVNSYLQLDCSARGQPPPSVYWYYNGEPAATSPALGRFQVNPDWTVQLASNNSLIVRSLTKQHSGQYTCRASNQNSEDSANISILVEGKCNFSKRSFLQSIGFQANQ